MDDFRAILDIAEHVLTLLALGGGIVGYVFRKYISAWIRSKFESEIGKQLASYKHNLDRELEAYKMSLVRDLEQLKANIDLRRSIALQIASTKLGALTQLFADLNIWVNSALAYTACPLEVRRHTEIEFNKKTDTMQSSYRAAEIHLPMDLRGRISDLSADLHTLAISFTGRAEQLALGDVRLRDFLQQNNEISDLLRQEVERIALT